MISAARRVLVIDDQRNIHQDFSKILAPSRPPDAALGALEADLFGETEVAPSGPAPGFLIDSAFQGQEGLEMVVRARQQQRPYDLAFVDVRMPPGWDGVETIEHIWRADPHLQVVLCTAFADYDWSALMARLGGRDNLLILRKPVDPVEVLQAAAALSCKWQLRQEAEDLLAGLEEQVRKRTAELEGANSELLALMQDRDRMEAELRLAQKLESMGQLAAGVAHEINTPLQFIGDNLFFLQGAFGDLVKCVDELSECVSKIGTEGHDAATIAETFRLAREDADLDYLNEAVPKAISSTLDGVSRTSAIVRSLKEFSHPSSKERLPTDVNKALETTLTVARNEYRYVAEASFEPGELPPVPCFAGELNQVLLNLVVNAAHAMADVFERTQTLGALRVTSSLEREFVLIRVSDTGGGIPEAIRAKVFDPFFTTKPVGKGTGQGLALARSIVVDKHGGQLDFISDPGVGTTFEIRLPLQVSAATSTPAPR